jgi:hypothetical protein
MFTPMLVWCTCSIFLQANYQKYSRVRRAHTVQANPNYAGSATMKISVKQARKKQASTSFLFFTANLACARTKK